MPTIITDPSIAETLIRTKSRREVSFPLSIYEQFGHLIRKDYEQTNQLLRDFNCIYAGLQDYPLIKKQTFYPNNIRCEDTFWLSDGDGIYYNTWFALNKQTLHKYQERAFDHPVYSRDPLATYAQQLGYPLYD